MTQTLVPLLIALGDDELILGHRHSEWTGWAPHIEEDVAFSSIAQTEIGHARAFYELACATAGVDADQVVFLDDLGINLKPAKAMGMTTIKVGDPAVAIADLEAVLGLTLVDDPA